MNVLVGMSGIWINKDFAYLDDSPGVLVYDNGIKLQNIVEVMCLKILRLCVGDYVNDDFPRIERQCVFVNKINTCYWKGHILLHKNHIKI